jgi:rhodanese-related sulfurtransferase
MKTTLIGVVAIALIVGVAGAAGAQQSDTERIAIDTLKERLDSGETFLLIDVREDWELEENGAIEGAIHIPVGELEARMSDIPKDIELVFY